MHHFTATTWLSFPRAETLRHIWQVEVPKLGLEYPFVMHQVLAVAALHLVFLHPDGHQRYAHHAFRHQTEALAGIRQSITNITKENCEAIFAASCLLLISAFATSSRSKDWLEQAQTPTIRDIVDVFSLIRGMYEIHSCSQNYLHRGKFAPFFEAQSALPPSSVLEETRQQLGSLWISISSCSNSGVICREIDVLLHWIQHCEATTTDPELRVTMTWPIYMSTEYISLLISRDSAALILLAHYCAVARTTEASAWYMKNWGRTALRAISESLDPAWEPYIQWPRAMISDGC
ncbi:hypothetical protein EDB81DRAFT_808472 [Dactylonectria macrodidyma]|uniref:Uncharacterized protein n=1 Tax=Dactylonectria macrodidyma TaxID=307937 RepID=A0A9P9DYT4_9HYPO|nr:hypothetical protein EDB81DRAFT_808472 [Dactylonectria macrodidyma]